MEQLSSTLHNLVAPLFGGGEAAKPEAAAAAAVNPAPKAAAASESNAPVIGADDDARIVLLLDQSGSIHDIQNDLIGSVNAFIEQQQKQGLDDKATFTLATFSDKVTWKIIDVPLAQVKPLKVDEYVPRGGTALLDILGDTIVRYNHVKDLVLTVVTDGQDTSSRRYTKAQIAEMLARKKADAGWEVIYLSCDEAGFAAGQALGVAPADNMRVAKSAMSENISFAMSSAVCGKRTQKSIAKSIR
jgi:hypothetical protein